MNNPDNTRGLLGAWRLKDTKSSISVSLKNIDRDQKYRLEQFPNTSEVTLKGEELVKDFAITLDSEFTASLFAFEKL